MPRLEVKWLPAVGAARYEVREQGAGDTPLERYENGIALGPRVDSTRFVFTSAESRSYNLSIRAYNRSGVASPQPAEATVSPGGGRGVWIPSDLFCVMYISLDEQFDQNGNELKPQLWNQQQGGFPFTSNVAPVGSDEWRRRLRYDQGFSENHMVLQMAPNSAAGGTTPPSGKDFAEARKSSPSNQHFECVADPDTATQRGLEQGQETALVVEPRDTFFGPQTDVDFLDNFTICGWINPCNLGVFGQTMDWSNSIHGMHIWARSGQCDITSPSADGTRGWQFYVGGNPRFSSVNPDRHSSARVATDADGFGFAYLVEGKRGAMTDAEAEVAEENTAVAWWAYDYRQGLIKVRTGSGGADYGKYCGWLFVTVTIGSTYTKGGITEDVSDFECWVGRADQDDLSSLGIITQERLRSTMWTNTTTPKPGSAVMVAIGNSDNSYLDDSGNSRIENLNIFQPYAMYDEMRIYNRVLDTAEIRGLYYHPGGQKRTENLLESERQVGQP